MSTTNRRWADSLPLSDDAHPTSAGSVGAARQYLIAIFGEFVPSDEARLWHAIEVAERAAGLLAEAEDEVIEAGCLSHSATGQALGAMEFYRSMQRAVVLLCVDALPQ